MGWLAGLKYRKKITIANAQVGATLSNFPVYVNLNADADIGLHAQADGGDILFTESDGTTLAPFETESWTGGGGGAATAHFWVKVASVSSSADTAIYLYYGTAGASSHANETATWDANYKGVWHLHDDLVNSVTGVAATDNSTVGFSTGKIASGRENDGGAGHHLESDITPIGSIHTIESWTNFNNNSVSQCPIGVHDSSNHRLYIDGRSDGKFGLGAGNALDGDAGNYFGGTWYRLALTLDGSTARFYVNGSEADNFGYSQTGNNTVTLKLLSRTFGAAINSPLAGIGDELRYSNLNRSAEWLAAEYVNQNTPLTFYSFGNQESIMTRKALYYERMRSA